jgi:hypothetical protein
MGMHASKYLAEYGGQTTHDHGEGVHVSEYTAVRLESPLSPQVLACSASRAGE